jgi:hypothetical protein
MTERDEVLNATVGDINVDEYLIMIYLGMVSYENTYCFAFPVSCNASPVGYNLKSYRQKSTFTEKSYFYCSVQTPAFGSYFKG